MELKQQRKRKLIKNLKIDSSSSESKTSGSEYEPTTENELSDSSISTDLEVSKERIDKNSDSSETSDKESLSLNDDVVPCKKRKKNKDSDSNVSLEDKVSKKHKVSLNKDKSTKKKEVKEADLDQSNVPNSSLDLSVNVESVGSVLQNKKNEFLLTSDKGIKKNVCYYCFKDKQNTTNPDKKVHFAKLVQHYEVAHSNEKEIIALKEIPKEAIKKGEKSTVNQKKREAILVKLRNKANYLNNRSAEDAKEYVVARRPMVTSKNTVANYGTCYKCYKKLSLSSIHKHVSKCTGLSFKNRHAVKTSSRATIGDFSPIASESAIKIISKLREDDILEQIRYDTAIFYWLNAEASKYETAIHNHDKVRANLRRLGNLKLQMKLLNDEIKEFSDIFHEDHYDHFIEACKILGKVDSDSKYLRSASTAHEMFFIIKSVADIYHVMIGKNQKQKREEIEAFTKKVNTMWHNSIGNTIAETQARNRRNKVINLPKESDLIRLRTFLEGEMSAANKSLKIKYTQDDYIKLRNALVSYLHVTNCRRAGEIEKLKVEDFNKTQIVNNNCRVEVRGKRTKPVPIVFEKQIYKYLQLLINNRKNAKIFKNNPYIFSNIADVSNDFTFVSACTLMNKFSQSCNAENPETLRGTLFRKQVATKGMDAGINDKEVEKLSNYLGHTPKIHMQNYRQSLFQRDIAVSQLVKEAQISQKTTFEAGTPKNTDDTEQDNYMQPEESVTGEDFHDSVEEESSNENNQNASNSSIPTASTQKRLKWTQASINLLMAYFPNSLDADKDVPSASEIRSFLATVKDDPNFKGRTEPQVRSWIHVNRKKSANEVHIPSKNYVPSYIYARFEKYIAAEKIPSVQACAKFLSQSPSKSNLSIKNIQDWVKLAIKRKSIQSKEI